MSYLIKIGDLELYKQSLQPSISGLGFPSIRTSSNDFSGADGGFIDGQFYSTRTLTISGYIQSNSYAELMTKRKEFISKLPIRSYLPVYIRTDDGNNYILFAYVTDVKMDLDHYLTSEFQITLTAPDPYIYDNGDGVSTDGYIEQTINRIVGGGYVVPMIFPYIYEHGTTPVTINNPSDIYIYPIFVITGKFTNPIITNVETGDFIKINISTSSSDTILINTDPSTRTITLNGGSILPDKSGSWLALSPGNNTLRLDSDSNDDDSSCIIKYRLPLLGV